MGMDSPFVQRTKQGLMMNRGYMTLTRLVHRLLAIMVNRVHRAAYRAAIGID